MADQSQSQLGAQFEKVILDATGASGMRVVAVIQELWSGYGQILRVGLDGAQGGVGSVIVKHVRLPLGASHPRGWDTDRSHARKVHSYAVEAAWYEDWAARCGASCRVPRALAMSRGEGESLFVLEDLDASGFAGRPTSVSWAEVLRCIDWLAHFHATFMGEEPKGLWETGTYWHLDTRPDELAALDADEPLRAAAAAIDARLADLRWKSFVHGDAKLANFCFPTSGDGPVAAVDFQYVGGGCGMKDLAYFAGSCLRENECEKREGEILDRYFATLALAADGRFDPAAVECEWRPLYPVAWSDFHRFLKGWSPGHWKINSYSERLAREVAAATLGTNTDHGTEPN